MKGNHIKIEENIASTAEGYCLWGNFMNGVEPILYLITNDVQCFVRINTLVKMHCNNEKKKYETLLLEVSNFKCPLLCLPFTQFFTVSNFWPNESER